jgi:arylsulfatase A-like enzyme
MGRGIILVVVDCLRADHVSSYAYARETTPTLDEIAAAGTRWSNAYATSSWTRPCVTSLLTGLYPTAHGATEGIKRSKGRLEARTHVLNETTPTVAQRLSAGGWRCGAFLNNQQLGEFSRLSRGFDEYHPVLGKADAILEAARNWVASDPQRPFFLYLHFLEAHWPYKPRRRHVAQFGGDRDRNHFRDFSGRDYAVLGKQLARGERTLSTQELSDMVLMYDAAIRRLDGKIRDVREALAAIVGAEGLTMLATADHGEELLDHGRIGHGHSLFEELIRVPLIAGGAGVPHGVVIDAPVSMTGMPDAILEIAGLGPQARLLRPGDDDAVYSELCIQHRLRQTCRVGRWKLHREIRFTPDDPRFDPAASFFDQRQRCSHAVHYELYDLADDPGERRDRAGDAACDDVQRGLLARLENWWSEQNAMAPTRAQTEVAVADPIVSQLRDLGYLE